MALPYSQNLTCAVQPFDADEVGDARRVYFKVSGATCASGWCAVGVSPGGMVGSNCVEAAVRALTRSFPPVM